MNHDNIFKKYPPYIRDSLGSKATYFEGIIIQFYNNERIQLKTKLTPLELRSQYVS